MLKGFLVSNDIAPPKKHDLPLLCDMCVEIDSRFDALNDISEFLTIFGVQPRYPNEITVLDEDADKALREIDKVMVFSKTFYLRRNQKVLNSIVKPPIGGFITTQLLYITTRQASSC